MLPEREDEGQVVAVTDPVLLGESAHAQHLVRELQHQLGQPVAEAVKQREGRRHCPGCTL
jgi:hypothetical protein